MNRLTSARADAQLERDICLVTWVATHSGESVGALTVESQAWRWTREGKAVPVPPGRHDLQKLVAGDGITDAFDIRLDPLCRSTGFPLPGCWNENLTPAEQSLMGMIVRETNYAASLFTRSMPRCAAWVRAVTSVIVPVLGWNRTSSSGSDSDIPGLVQIAGWNGPVAVLE